MEVDTVILSKMVIHFTVTAIGHAALVKKLEEAPSIWQTIVMERVLL